MNLKTNRLSYNRLSYKEMLLLVLIGLTLAFIWGHSLIPATGSAKESMRLMVMINEVLSKINAPVQLQGDKVLRKIAHATEYLVLGLFMMLAAANAKRRGVFFTGLITWIIGTAYAISDEVHQIFVPGRSCELRDMCIDAAGVLCGVLIIAGVRHRRALKCEGAGALVK